MSTGKGSHPHIRPFTHYFAAAEWSETNLEPGCVIVCRKPYLFHVVSGHKTMNFLFNREPDKIFRDMVDRGADYLPAANPGFGTYKIYLEPTLIAHRSRLKPVFRLDRPLVYILEIIPESKEK